MTAVAEKKITVAEFLEMDFEEGYIYELINGEIMRRTSPNLDHQAVSMELSAILHTFVKSNNLGKIFAAPVDVYLNEFDLVVPDLVFVAKENMGILYEKRCIVGVPDLIIEILSKGTQKRDKGDKMKLYRKHAVKEYWLINPRSQTVEIYEWRDGDYELMFSLEDTGVIQSIVLTDFSLEIADFFV
jgi:Uma2 family endonuclease